MKERRFTYKVQLSEDLSECYFVIEGGGMRVEFQPPVVNNETTAIVTFKTWQRGEFVRFLYSNGEMRFVAKNTFSPPIGSVENLINLLQTLFTDLLFEINGAKRFDAFVKNYPTEYLRVYEDRVNKEVGKLNKSIHKLNTLKRKFIRELTQKKDKIVRG